MRKFCLSAVPRSVASLVAVTAAVCIPGPCRGSSRTFDSSGRVRDEYGFANKMRDVSVVTGMPKPTSAEGEWFCRFKPTERMQAVVRQLLNERGWQEAEIVREIDEMFASNRIARYGAQYANWGTVEEFQRTPWYRRYRPNDTAQIHFCSIECFKILEEELIPPSQRSDPYSHLRKRHYEDNFMNERFSEDAARHITRDELAKQTRGMPQCQKSGRAAFLEFDQEYRKEQGGRFIPQNEVYQAWVRKKQREKMKAFDDDDEQVL